jgi:hypothetical protein
MPTAASRSGQAGSSTMVVELGGRINDLSLSLFRGSGRIQQHNVSAFSFASDRCKVSFPFLIRLMR